MAGNQPSRLDNKKFNIEFNTIILVQIKHLEYTIVCFISFYFDKSSFYNEFILLCGCWCRWYSLLTDQ